MSAPERVPPPPSIASLVGAIELSDVDHFLAITKFLKLARYFVIHSALLCIPIIICRAFLHLDVIWEETRPEFYLTFKQFKFHVVNKRCANCDGLTFVTPNNV